MLRRFAVLAALLLAALLALAAGCGASSPAQQYVDRGDELLSDDSFDISAEEMEQTSQEVFTAITQAVQSGQPIGEEIVAKANELIESQEMLIAGFDKAKAEYEKASKEPDAGDYKTYADLQIEYVDLSNQYSVEIVNILKDAASQLSVEGFSQEEWDARLQQFFPSLQEALVKTEELQEKIDAARDKL
jgi:hypothetical protein